jgi:hypothetical protein
MPRIKSYNFFLQNVKISFLAIFIFSCESNKVSEIDINELNRIDSTKKSLIGRWGGPNDTKSVFEITIDSITIGDGITYKYDIIGKDLFFLKEQDSLRLVQIKVVKDTISFKDQFEDYTTYGYRCKEI